MVKFEIKGARTLAIETVGLKIRLETNIVLVKYSREARILTNAALLKSIRGIRLVLLSIVL